MIYVYYFLCNQTDKYCANSGTHKTKHWVHTAITTKKKNVTDLKKKLVETKNGKRKMLVLHQGGKKVSKKKVRC